MNGVILITSKKGRAGQKGFGVDFNASYNNDQVAYLPRYQNVRGPGYFTSLSDAGQQEDGFIQVTPEKTQDAIYVPVHDTVLRIIEKYNGTLPPVPSNQKTNDYLKDIGEKLKCLKYQTN